MRFPSLVGAFALSAFLTASIAANETDLQPDHHAEVDTPPPPQEAAAKVRAQFETLRMGDNDFKLSPGWALPFTVRAIEDFFEQPLDIPVTAGDWADRIEQAGSLSAQLETAHKILGLGSQPAATNDPATIPPLPPALKKPVAALVSALRDAQPYLDRAVDSVPNGARQEFLALYGWPDANTGAVRQEISARRVKRRYDAMKTFSENDLAAAAQRVFAGLDAALASLPKKTALGKRICWKTANGDVLIGGSGDDVYDKEILKDVSILIDLGGDNTYKTPVAAAREREIRVAIDMGENVTVEGAETVHGNAGSGVFGIGAFVLPNPAGLKVIKTADFSQGAGIAGVGALAVSGPAQLTGQNSTQGMGAFGVGILHARSGKGSSYVATRTGQGAALTRGVGIFLHEGNDASIKGGLVQPDPREPLGSVSMCQGVGFGPRAYAGGGVGIAIVKGDGNSVKGSYFSQGVGYWHGFGVFRLRGDDNTTQARRYDMGSGVHNAFGHMDVFGNKNRILNWGVGPSYGWDHGIGSSLIQGDENEIQTEWGAGTASIGSLSFSMIKGDRNKLKLCDFGTNNFFRDEPAYSVHVIEGLENRLQCQGVAETAGARVRRMRTPWGLFQMEGVALEADLKLAPPEWPELPREEAVEKEMVNLGERLEEAAAKPALEQVGDIIDVAAAFSLDKATPRQAMRELLALPPEKAALMADALEPAAVDQMIYLSVAMPAHGDATARPMIKLLSGGITVHKKAVLVSFLRMARPTTVVPALTTLLQQQLPDELRLGILRTMGVLLNKDAGTEPGPRAALTAVLRNLESPGKRNKKPAAALLSRMKFGEGFGMLATVTDANADDRAAFFEVAPEDLTGNVGEAGAETLLRIAARNRKTSLANARNQIETLEALEPDARRQLTELLQSTRAAVVNAAVVALGQIGNKEDAEKLGPLTRHANTRVRESAAVALVRLGEAGFRLLSRAMASDAPRDRALALAAVTQAVSPKFLPLIEKGLSDNDPIVRLTAVTVIDNLPEALRTKRPKLVARAKRVGETESDPDVELAIELLK